MNDSSNVSGILGKKIGPLTVKHLIALIISFVLATVLICFGWADPTGMMCFGLILIPVILYMIPHLLGVEGVKIFAVFGVAFMIVALALGAFVCGPGYVNEYDEPSDNDYFSDITYTYEGSSVTMTADIGKTTDLNVYFCTVEITSLFYQSAMSSGNPTIKLLAEAGTVTTGDPITTTVDLDPDKLYAGYLILASSNDGSSLENSEGSTRWTFLADAYDGSYASLCLSGCGVVVAYVMIVFFLLLFLSAFMRKRFEVARDKMEKDGRLYPQGYGRCANCNGIVLPGEINCRKCGTYIDRPDELKPDKKDFFECSDCGAEVPADAKVCPKCGATFDEDDEIVVTHADGNVETTNKTATCPECGETIPVTAAFCPRCGRKNDKL